MGKKIICYIQAFNCEHTIAATMRSVQNQTYDDWLCFVLSNGNRNTVEAPNWSLDIIKSVAAGDSRFIVLNKRTNSLDMYVPTLYYLANCFPDSYICSLDADDEYQSDFFARGIALAEEHDLDIVACGTEIRLKENEETVDSTLLSRREVQEDLVIREGDFTRQFLVYKPFFNEMWGKLYRAGLFGPQHSWAYAQRHFFRHFLPDTLFTMDNLSRSRAIGILSGTSHRFYQYRRRKESNATLAANSHAAAGQLFHRKNKFSVYDTHKTIMDFLQAHGEIDSELNEYMQAVLIGWFGDYYTRTLLPVQDEKTFAELAKKLVFNPKFDEAIRYRDSGKYNNLRGYETRIAFCRKLRNTALGQRAIRNREIGAIGNLPCSHATGRELDRLIHKLDETICNLLEKQEEGE